MLENTDKAIAQMIEGVQQLAQQTNPEVFNTFATAAMYGAQSELWAFKVGMWIAGFFVALGLLIVVASIFSQGDGEAVGVGVMLLVIAAVFFGCFTIGEYNPLREASAKDGKIALAVEAMAKMQLQ